MQWFRKMLARMLVIVVTSVTVIQPGAAIGPLPFGGSEPVSVKSDDPPCSDCSNDACNAQSDCTGSSCVRLAGQPLARLETPAVRFVVPAGDIGHPATTTDFTFRAIKPALPPPRA